MKESEFYSSRRLNEPYISNLMDVNLQKYVLDPRMRAVADIQTQKTVVTAQSNQEYP